MTSTNRTAARATLTALTASAVVLGVVFAAASDVEASPAEVEAVTVALTEPTELDEPAESDEPGEPSAGGDLKRLHDDLAAARKLDGEARRDALQKIRQDVRDGEYGSRLERRADRRAERRADRREVVYALLPDELQDDLDAVKAAPEEERADLRAEIMRKALAGDYGPKVADAAEKLRELRER